MENSNKQVSIIKNMFIYFCGNILSKLLGFLLLPFYTYYLVPKDYGYWDLISTSLLLLFPIVALQINQGLYIYLLECKEEAEKKELINNGIKFVIKNLIVFDIIYVIIINIINIEYSILILILINVNIIYNVLNEITRGLRHNYIYSLSGIINTFIMLIFNILLIVVFKMRVEGLIVANILGNLITCIFIIFKLNLFKFFHCKSKNKTLIKKLLLYSIPMIPNSISWWIMNVSDRYVLNHFCGLEANGVYAVANKFPSILLMLNSVFYLAWQESAIIEKSSKNKNAFYEKTFNSLLVMQFSAVLILIAFTKTIFKAMINENYIYAWRYTPFLYLASAFSVFSAFYGTFNQVEKETKNLMYSSIIGGIINFVINLALVKKIGIQAASLSTMISFAVMWIWRVFQTKRYVTISINKSNISIFSVLISIYCSLIYYENAVIELLLMVMSIIIFIIFNKTLFILLFKMTKDYFLKLNILKNN